MKRVSNQNKTEQDNEMMPEYDFAKMSGGIRGKYHKAVKIHKDDGSVEVHYFTIEDGAVMLEPDVQEYFPDSESVNNALRSLISLIPDKHQTVKAK
jgi:hypothetical protein